MTNHSDDLPSALEDASDVLVRAFKEAVKHVGFDRRLLWQIDEAAYRSRRVLDAVARPGG